MQKPFSEIKPRELFVGTFASYGGIEVTALFLKMGEKAGSLAYGAARLKGRNRIELRPTEGPIHFFKPEDLVQKLEIATD